MIKGVELRDLKIHFDGRGYLFEAFHSTDAHIAYAYVCAAWPGMVKAWHYHLKHEDKFVVVGGVAKIQLVDLRAESSTVGEANSFVLTATHPQLVWIPARVAHGFKAIVGETAVLLNFPDMLYDGGVDEYRIENFDVVEPIYVDGRKADESPVRLRLPSWEEGVW